MLHVLKHCSMAQLVEKESTVFLLFSPHQSIKSHNKIQATQQEQDSGLSADGNEKVKNRFGQNNTVCRCDSSFKFVSLIWWED